MQLFYEPVLCTATGAEPHADIETCADSCARGRLARAHDPMPTERMSATFSAYLSAAGSCNILPAGTAALKV